MQYHSTAQETVTVAVRGRILDSALFAMAHDAAVYKAAVRAWALERGVIVQLFTGDIESALRRAS